MPLDRQPGDRCEHASRRAFGIHSRVNERRSVHHLGQEGAPASHELDAGDSALHELELGDAVVNIGLVVHNVLVGIVGHQLTAESLSTLHTFKHGLHFAKSVNDRLLISNVYK